MVVPKDVPVPKSLLHKTSLMSRATTSAVTTVPREMPSIQTAKQYIVSNPVDTSGPTRRTRSGIDELQNGIDSLIKRIVENEHPPPVYSHIASQLSNEPANTGLMPAPVINTTASLEGPIIHTYSSLYTGPSTGTTTLAPSAPSVYIDLDPDTSDELQNDYPGSSTTMYMSTAIPINPAQPAPPAMPFVATRLRGPSSSMPFDTTPRFPPPQGIGINPPIPDTDNPPRSSFDSPMPMPIPSMYIPPVRSFIHRPRGPRPRNFNKELYGLYRNQIVLKKYICPQCGRRCLKKSDLTRHIRVHTGEKPFTCEICLKKFSEKHNFYNHMRRSHPDYCQWNMSETIQRET